MPVLGSIPFSKAELFSLLQAIKERYGYDFSEYTLSTMARRIDWTMKMSGHCDLVSFERAITEDPALLGALVKNMSISVTSMFRDPLAYRELVTRVFPILATYPHIRIWCAGVATGEEAYSVAILLREAGLYERSLIYATDFNPVVLERASKGVLPLEKMAEYTSNYIEAGGQNAFSKYYIASDKGARIRSDLRENIVFATHNLVSDGVFNEFQLILCRNVLIYFDSELMDKVLDKLRRSLALRCFLFLGDAEHIATEEKRAMFETFSKPANIFRAREYNPVMNQ